MQVLVPVSHCKDTHNFEKTNNFFKKVKEMGRETSAQSLSGNITKQMVLAHRHNQQDTIL